MSRLNSGMGGISLDLNQLYNQQKSPSLYDQLAGNQLGGYLGFGNQLQNAMGAFGQVAALNSINNNNLNQANLGYATGYQAPVDVAHIADQGKTDRLAQLSPLLTSIFGGLGGLMGGAGGSSGGGLQGFSASGADGKPFASASIGSGGAGGVGTAQPGNASTAQPNAAAQYYSAHPWLTQATQLSPAQQQNMGRQLSPGGGFIRGSL